MKTIERHQILDHGVDGEQYFQGCSTSFTEFTDVATGIGDSAHEALEDALEQLAFNDWDVESIKNKLSETVDVPETAEDSDEPSDMHHYVSIRVK
jgi:hypothetical protein